MDSDEFLRTKSGWRPSRWMIQDQIYNLSRLVVFQCWDSWPKAADSIFVFFFKTHSNGVFKNVWKCKNTECNSSCKSLYVWNNAHFKHIFSIFFDHDPNQRRQVYIHSWVLSGHSFYDFQMHFNVSISYFSIFFSPAALFEKEKSLSFFDTLTQTFLTGTQLLSLGSELNDSFPPLDDPDVFGVFSPYIWRRAKLFQASRSF